MIFLYIHEKYILKKSLSLFKGCSLINFHISNSSILITNLDVPLIRTSIGSEFFSCSRSLSFTISLSDLIEYLDLLETCVFEISSGFLLLRDHNLFGKRTVNEIELFYQDLYVQTHENSPVITLTHEFIMATTECYAVVPFSESKSNIPVPKFGESTVEFICTKELLHHFPRDRARYILDRRLTLIETKDVLEERVVLDVDFLKDGNCEFTVSNTWIKNVLNVMQMLDKTIFVVQSDCIVFRATLKEFSNVQIEIISPFCVNSTF